MAPRTMRPRKVETRPTATLPKNWPDDIQFLSEQTYSTAVTADLRGVLSSITSASVSCAKISADSVKTPCPLVEIRIITDEKHPAYLQRGLFASLQLEPDSLICIYRTHSSGVKTAGEHPLIKHNPDSWPRPYEELVRRLDGPTSERRSCLTVRNVAAGQTPIHTATMISTTIQTSLSASMQHMPAMKLASQTTIEV